MRSFVDELNCDKIRENKSRLNSITFILQQEVARGLNELFEATVDPAEITINDTRKEFEGDLTVVIFPLLRYTKRSPEESGQLLGEYLRSNVEEVAQFNVVKGFLNCSLTKTYWKEVLSKILKDEEYGMSQPNGQKVMVEYSSPNTNKPIHLGHIRNIVLGYAVSGMLKAGGYEVIKANLINDRGIHICKSMLAWQKWGNGETPESSGMKGDHLVGKYYVQFNEHFKPQIADLVAGGMDEKEAAKKAPLILEAQEMLQKWEAGDPEVTQLWKTMNDWVYSGFHVTYDTLGVDFDQMYYESDTYLLGKEVVMKGLEEDKFIKKEDGSVWIDLTADGLDEKLLLRADGTSVYMTQDIGTADLKYSDHKMDRSIYVVGNEQDYHFKVLQLICRKIGRPYADGIYHLSYGMVELPYGKMKSREGTVVDADEIVEEMINTARERTQELGKIEGFSDEEAEELYRTIALGALKFYLLRVDPKKNMMFNPDESIDLQGHTGPFVQYTHARIKSLLRKSPPNTTDQIPEVAWEPLEQEIIKGLARFPEVIESSARELDPASLVDYAYHLAKLFNKYYAEVSILNAPNAEFVHFRLILSHLVARTIEKTFAIVGINVPDRM